MTPCHCRRTATPMSGKPSAQARPYSLFQEVRYSRRSVKVRTTQIKPAPLAHQLATMAPQLRRAVWTKCRGIRKFFVGCVRVSRGLSQNSSRLIRSHCRVDSARTHAGKQFPSGVPVSGSHFAPIIIYRSMERLVKCLPAKSRRRLPKSCRCWSIARSTEKRARFISNTPGS